MTAGGGLPPGAVSCDTDGLEVEQEPPGDKWEAAGYVGPAYAYHLPKVPKEDQPDEQPPWQQEEGEEDQPEEPPEVHDDDEEGLHPGWKNPDEEEQASQEIRHASGSTEVDLGAGTHTMSPGCQVYAVPGMATTTIQEKADDAYITKENATPQRATGKMQAAGGVKAHAMQMPDWADDAQADQRPEME